MHNDFQPLALNLQPCLSDALADVLYLPAPRLRQAGALTPAEIKIVEGAAKYQTETPARTE
jgi:hypothetical protein